MSLSNGLQEALKPFHQRASEAEERLAKLEAAVATKTGTHVEAPIATRTDTRCIELSKKVAELQKLLEDVESERLAEREKALKDLQRVTEENAKLHYRISHLVRALEKANSDLALK